MKVRNGFVSNSSSSSFVLLGAKIKRLKFSDEQMIKLMNEHGIEYDSEWPDGGFWDALYNEEFGFSYLGEESIVGRFIAHGGDYGLDESKTSLEQINKIAKEVKKDIKDVLGIDIDVKLMTGQQCC